MTLRYVAWLGHATWTGQVIVRTSGLDIAAPDGAGQLRPRWRRWPVKLTEIEDHR